MKIKRKQLLEIQTALRGISAVKVSESPWEIVRNLKTITKVVDEQDDLYKKFYEECVDKDEQGNPVKYREKTAGGAELEMTKVTDPEKLKVHADFVNKMMEEEHELAIIQVSKNAFKKLISRGELDLNYLVPLLDVMIPDDTKPPEEKEEE